MASAFLAIKSLIFDSSLLTLYSELTPVISQPSFSPSRLKAMTHGPDGEGLYEAGCKRDAKKAEKPNGIDWAS
jgi:hypothetical protein